MLQHASSSRNLLIEDTKTNVFPVGCPNIPIFVSILQQLHDDHSFSPDPFCALADFIVLLHKAKKTTKRELSRQTPDCIGAKLLNHLYCFACLSKSTSWTLMLFCEAWKPVEDCFDTLSFERLSQIFALLVKTLKHVKLQMKRATPWRMKMNLSEDFVSTGEPFSKHARKARGIINIKMFCDLFNKTTLWRRENWESWA